MMEMVRSSAMDETPDLRGMGRAEIYHETPLETWVWNTFCNLLGGSRRWGRMGPGGECLDPNGRWNPHFETSVSNRVV
jgi:hypothetical protein